MIWHRVVAYRQSATSLHLFIDYLKKPCPPTRSTNGSRECVAHVKWLMKYVGHLSSPSRWKPPEGGCSQPIFLLTQALTPGLEKKGLQLILDFVNHPAIHDRHYDSHSLDLVRIDLENVPRENHYIGKFTG